MPIAVLQEKITMLPEKYIKEVSDFVDFLITKSEPVKKDNTALVRSLIGSVPDNFSLEQAKSERLSQI